MKTKIIKIHAKNYWIFKVKWKKDFHFRSIILFLKLCNCSIERFYENFWFLTFDNIDLLQFIISYRFVLWALFTFWSFLIKSYAFELLRNIIYFLQQSLSFLGGWQGMTWTILFGNIDCEPNLFLSLRV